MNIYVIQNEPEKFCVGCAHYWHVPGTDSGLCFERDLIMSTGANWWCDRWTPCDHINEQETDEMTVGDYFALRKAVGR